APSHAAMPPSTSGERRATGEIHRSTAATTDAKKTNVPLERCPDAWPLTSHRPVYAACCTATETTMATGSGHHRRTTSSMASPPGEQEPFDGTAAADDRRPTGVDHRPACRPGAGRRGH